jgi:hypothetical protein
MVQSTQSSSTTVDRQGREYARLSELYAGMYVQVDSGFTCLAPWTIHKVKRNEGRLFIGCADGHHYLEGQLAANGDSLVGIYYGHD